MATALFAREKLIATARSLPAAPQVLTELGQLLQDINVELDQIAELLKRDAALAARIIRISNSTVFGGSGRIAAIEEAVNRVGFSEVYRLVGIATTSRLADRALAYYQVDAEKLREHMFCTAVAAETIAEMAGVSSRDAYTAGLMRSIGMLILDRVAREKLILSQAYDGAKYQGYLEWEGQLFGIGNAEVTALILEDWRFPPELIEGLRHHYLLGDESYGNRFACLLNLAGHVVNEVGCALPGELPYWTPSPRKFEAAGFREERLGDAIERTRERFEKQRSSLHGA